MNEKKTKIVILGGGFAGVNTALQLEKEVARDEDIEILLISDENFILFTPMLPEVPSSSIEAKHIVSPLRAFFRKVKVENREVHTIDLEKRVLIAAHCSSCELVELKYDHLVLALGSRTDSRGIPGVAENAFPMKSLNDAMVLRNHIIDVFEHADLQQDSAARKSLLTFVVAGAGFAGVETVAELKDFALEAHTFYPNIHPEEVTVLLVHLGPRILPEIGDSLAAYALKKLRSKRIDVRLNTGVKGATSDCPRDPWFYQQYIQSSRAEFTVAKHGYVISSSGWFSERTAAYLASARPVIIQDTGFGTWLPESRAVLVFRSPEEAVQAIASLQEDYDQRCREARALVAGYFSHATVLNALIEQAFARECSPSAEMRAS